MSLIALLRSSVMSLKPIPVDVVVVPEADALDKSSVTNYVVGRAPVKRRWYAWYADTDSPKERKLLIKMDLIILSYAFLGFWVKYIDNGNLTNAYVSGMKEGYPLWRWN